MTRSLWAAALGLLLVSGAAQAQHTREVPYNPRSVVPVKAKLRFTTMIILPDTEDILDFVCGDKDMWVVSGAQNLAYIKPAKAGASTNLNLVTAAGHVYSFLLTEGATNPDLKIYITPDEAFASVPGAPPRFYAAAQVEALRREADEARAAAEASKTTAAAVI